MKLFGNSQRNDDFDKTARIPTVPQDKQPKAAKGAGKQKMKPSAQEGYPTYTGGKKKKKVKLPLTRAQKIKRAVLITLIVLAACGVGAAIWFSTVHAPTAIADKTWKTSDGDTSEMGERISDYFTFIVGAVDEDETRTDSLMVVSFDTKNKKINILNIPRDTMTNSGRRGASAKINAAYGTKGKIETTKSDIKDILGFSPDYYMIVNFKGIAQIVDAIGGVDYEIPFRMYYKDPSQDLDIDFKPGMTHLNGEQTVEFLRWRKNNGGVKTGDKSYTGGDEQRIEKQQEFLKYLASQVLSPSNATKIPAIAKAVFANVKTDFSTGELLWMGTQASGIDKANLQTFTLPGYSQYSYAGTSEHLSFFFPDETETLTMVNQYFNPYKTQIADLNIISGPSERSSSGSSGSDDDESSSSVRHKTKTSSTENTQKASTDAKKTTDSKTGTTTDQGSTQTDSGTNQGGGKTDTSAGTGTDSDGADTSSGTGSTTETPSKPAAETPSTPQTPTTTPATSGDPEA